MIINTQALLALYIYSIFCRYDLDLSLDRDSLAKFRTVITGRIAALCMPVVVLICQFHLVVLDAELRLPL